MPNRTASNARPSASTALHKELEKAAAGLLFISESDFPFRFFTLPGRGETGLTAQSFLSRIGIAQEFLDEHDIQIGQLVEERTLDHFFPTLEDLANGHGTDTSDPEVIAESKRFRKLEALLRKRLRDVKVLRVGKVDVRCYIVGLDQEGDIAGLVTTSIET